MRRRVRTPRRVPIETGEWVVRTGHNGQEKYVFSTGSLEIPQRSEHSAFSATGASDPHPSGARGKNRDGFVSAIWMSCEFTSHPLGSEMEELMKPESTIRNENEMRAAVPAASGAPVTQRAHGNLSVPASSPGDEKADRTEKIRARAYELFLERGSREGGEIMDWLDAEQEVEAAPEKSYRAGAGSKSN
jgi:hypothetical protein